MRQLVTGLALGITVGILGTLEVQHRKERAESVAANQRQRAATGEANHTTQLFDAVPTVMERALPGIKVLDVAVGTPSTHNVGYQHEALYDAQIKYQLGGRIKRVVLPFGFTNGALVTPTTADVVIADDKAAVIATLSSETKKSMQPTKQMLRTTPARAMEPRR